VNTDEARERFAAARVARLATTGASGRPHLVPIVFAVEADTVYNAVDMKPKRTTALQRIANVRAHPEVTLLVDHYDDVEWSSLWWVRADGVGRVLDPDTDEARHAVALLQGRYSQHRAEPPIGAVLAIHVERWTGWSAR
jgi:PPOX class probable F420-dependent enzyme